nr:MAG TPA: hypothetical protein [Caudoviricetes sp.]
MKNSYNSTYYYHLTFLNAIIYIVHKKATAKIIKRYILVRTDIYLRKSKVYTLMILKCTL